MSISRHRNQPAKQKGFTLTELAIVLGVMGLILSAIWVSAGQTYNNNKGQRAAAEMLEIINGYRTLWGNRGVDAGNWVDVTCLGINGNYFPSDMIQSGTKCTAGGSGAQTPNLYPVSPWGTPATVVVDAFQAYNGIIVSFTNLSQSACISLATSSLTDPNIIWEGINSTFLGSGQPLGAAGVFTTSGINTACVAGAGSCGGGVPGTSGNCVQVMYPAK